MARTSVSSTSATEDVTSETLSFYSKWKEGSLEREVRQMSSRKKLPVPRNPTSAKCYSQKPLKTESQVCRWQYYNDDPMVASFSDKEVVCQLCGGVTELSLKNLYDLEHWTRHRESCLVSHIAFGDSIPRPSSASKPFRQRNLMGKARARLASTPGSTKAITPACRTTRSRRYLSSPTPDPASVTVVEETASPSPSLPSISPTPELVMDDSVEDTESHCRDTSSLLTTPQPPSRFYCSAAASADPRNGVSESLKANTLSKPDSPDVCRPSPHPRSPGPPLSEGFSLLLYAQECALPPPFDIAAVKRGYVDGNAIDAYLDDIRRHMAANPAKARCYADKENVPVLLHDTTPGRDVYTSSLGSDGETCIVTTLPTPSRRRAKPRTRSARPY